MNKLKRKLVAACLIGFVLCGSYLLAALPNQLKSARMSDATLGNTIDNHVGDLETAITDILGIPIGTNISAALFDVVAAGLKTVVFQDAAGDPSASGRLQRNATALKYHDGTSAKTVVLGSQPNIVVKFTIPAAGCNNTSAGPLFEIHTSNSATATCYGTNPHRFAGLDFPDGSSDLEVGGHWLLPSDWIGNIDFRWTWFCGSVGTCSTNNVLWTIKTACVADGEDLLNPTYNNPAQTVTDASLSTVGARNVASQAAVTTTGCSAGETFFFKFGRKLSDAADTLAATAVLMDFEATLVRSN